MKNRHIGTSFDDFLQEEGLLAAVEATAVKRIIAYQIEKEMEARHISKSALARMMRTSRSSLDGLLDPENSCDPSYHGKRGTGARQDAESTIGMIAEQAGCTRYGTNTTCPLKG